MGDGHGGEYSRSIGRNKLLVANSGPARVIEQRVAPATYNCALGSAPSERRDHLPKCRLCRRANLHVPSDVLLRKSGGENITARLPGRSDRNEETVIEDT
uniref:Uncharacterized protein n=2 Tax=Rhizobium/Agrobacterium group TaxID=227290 RepID=A0A2Z2PTU4_AGRTU|nr:hypothetical protein [Rhizobium rhizogenes]ASK45495.1 hypothetical protein [Agrobacterium radiobacter]ASK45825.1 hypothetical protein [Agrobacterium tumefaciens]ASK45840.1 hypothetical protein [Agrobacterium radiobacter]